MSSSTHEYLHGHTKEPTHRVPAGHSVSDQQLFGFGVLQTPFTIAN